MIKLSTIFHYCDWGVTWHLSSTGVCVYKDDKLDQGSLELGWYLQS